MDKEDTIKERREKLFSFIKGNINLIVYLLLAVVVFLAVKIRTKNIPGLRDVTTGSWALGPDLDPYLFLRWAKHIVENGSLMAMDMMRYAPRGFYTGEEYLLHPYMIAWFHNIARLFGSESVTYSAIIYPVFFFVLTLIAFFFLTRKIFIEKFGERIANTIALVASLFLTILPPLLPRTIAGIPEKESAAFFFLFASFYFFISSWRSDKKYGKYVLSILAGIFTAGMAFTWGGYIFIFMVIGPAVFISFLLEKINREKFTLFGIWLISSFSLMLILSERYTITNLISSTSTGSSVAVFFLILIHFILFDTPISKYLNYHKLGKIPPKIISTFISLAVGILLSLVLFGSSFLASQLSSVKNTLTRPATSRLIQTVAENKQPYFTEWVGNFGPVVAGFPVLFWLFTLGSIYLFYICIGFMHKKERIYLSSSFGIFLFALIFSRYSPQSTLNGESNVSLLLLVFGFVAFIGCGAFYYYKYFKEEKIHDLKNIDFGIIILLVFFIIGLISARAAARTVMVLVPSISILVAFFVVNIFQKAYLDKQKVSSIIIASIVIVATVFSAYTFYNVSNSQASAYVPGAYNQQWQKAMSWVRENTSEDAVFAHWWDYGYWVQSIGERTTILDGGNSISYWNHLMGRFVLTGTSENDSLEFLYSHNATHLLIDSTDIGKYGAFSYIGSDENLDRRDTMPVMLKDASQTTETKNGFVELYRGGYYIEEDILYKNGHERIFLPAGQAIVGGVIVNRNLDGKINQPIAVFVHQGKQYNLPMRYAFENELTDFKEGIESGAFIFPRGNQAGSGITIDDSGALIFLSPRTVNSQLTKLYLYGEDTASFELAHVEDDFLVAQIKMNNREYGSSFIYFGGFRGPIKIWKINYPGNISYKEEYLSTEYPRELYIG